MRPPSAGAVILTQPPVLERRTLLEAQMVPALLLLYKALIPFIKATLNPHPAGQEDVRPVHQPVAEHLLQGCADDPLAAILGRAVYVPAGACFPVSTLHACSSRPGYPSEHFIAALWIQWPVRQVSAFSSTGPRSAVHPSQCAFRILRLAHACRMHACCLLLPSPARDASATHSCAATHAARIEAGNHSCMPPSIVEAARLT